MRDADPVKGTTKPWESKIGGCLICLKGLTILTRRREGTVVTEGQAPAVAASVVAGPFAGLDGGTTTVPSAATGEAVEQVEERKLLPLRFLAQVNFSEMPPLDGFPTKGILQFYIAGENAHRVEFRESGRAEGIPGDLSRGSRGK